MIDAAGRIVLVNRKTAAIFGYEAEELIGQPVEVLVPARVREAHPGFRAKFLFSPSTRAMGAGRDLYGVRKDGSEVPVEIGLNPIETDEGVSGWAVSRDGSKALVRIEDALQLIDVKPDRADIEILAVRANDIAEEAGSYRSANMVMLGALLKRRPAVASMNAVLAVLDQAVSARHRELNQVNRKALAGGYQAA